MTYPARKVKNGFGELCTHYKAEFKRMVGLNQFGVVMLWDLYSLLSPCVIGPNSVARELWGVRN